MLIACQDCHRHYDVRHLEEGRRIRCECGKTLAVAEPRPHSPHPLRCYACGGPLSKNLSYCEFCGGEITLEEKNLDAVCPVCFARLPHDAHYCVECGIQIAPQILSAIPEGARCPRCKGRLRNRSLQSISFVECASCAGLWISPEAFERLCHDQSMQESALREMKLAHPAPLRLDPKVEYLPCICCGDRMVRRNFLSSGVLTDWCGKHGVWLDHDELPRILDYIRQGGKGRFEAREEREAELARQIRRELGGYDVATISDRAAFEGIDLSADLARAFHRTVHWLEDRFHHLFTRGR